MYYVFAFLILAAVAAVVYALLTANEGYEDKGGFHHGRPPKIS